MTSIIKRPKALRLGTNEWAQIHTIQMPYGIYPFLIISGSTMISCQTWGDGTAFIPEGSFSQVKFANYVLTVDLGATWGCWVICFL